MIRRRPSFLRALLLIVVALGPLQAQTAFACSMMESIVYDECCCEHHEPAGRCPVPEFDPALETETPCCDRSVEIGVDEDVAGQITTVKSAELRFDADPPPGLLPSPEAFFLPDPPPAPGELNHLPVTGESGSDTWLLTRRLRI